MIRADFHSILSVPDRSDNKLFGGIPETLSELTNLQSLDLSSNKVGRNRVDRGKAGEIELASFLMNTTSNRI